MAKKHQPVFTQNAVLGQVAFSTANTNRDGTGTLATVLTGATDDTKVSTVRIKATGTTTAGMIRLFITVGATTTLFEELPVTAIVPSGTVESFEGTFDLSALEFNLPSAAILKVSTNNAQSFVATALAGNF